MTDSEKNGSTAGTKILVVDDDKNAAAYIADLLRGAGFRISVCSSGPDALEFVKKQPADLVLLDVRMPGMDGFEAAREMKKIFGKNNFVPIIFLTAVAGQNEKIAGLKLADDFITKPFNADELLARIRVMLRIRGLQRELLVSKSKYEEEQRIARAQLYRSARLASIGTFASGVAHEFNNPLTAILGFSSALVERMRKKETVDPDELEQYLGIINAETLRCRDTVDNLSRFAREGDTQIREFPLGECVDGAWKLVKTRAAKKRIEIAVNIPATMRVKADLQKLQQAMVYVLTNSLDFCGEGSTVSISAESDEGFARVIIADNGPGIPAAVLPKVFDPFFTTKQVGQGMGLGLAMCHVIMEECSGAIDVSSEAGKGTTVVLEVPVA
ncbi:MAG TPA: response regulator [Chitinivibrionales bacterium]|nr:response regulator [Chitinivibrionales bacterium]